MSPLRVWIDLANSPHVPLMVPIHERLQAAGHDVLLTGRDHAQTLELAQRHWPEVRAIGGASPNALLPKAIALGRRAAALRRYASKERPDIAFSHGSYAQVVAATAARIPAVVMMDYEHQPANHLSFRLARKVIVPDFFPETALRRFGAVTKTVRYPGFKEELYLEGFEPNPSVLSDLGLERDKVIVVFRPAPTGALYHREENEHFDALVESARVTPGVQVVLLPRNAEQAQRYGTMDGVLVPPHAVDARSLLTYADVAIGAGGTMNRESALLGTPTYTVFQGALSAVDSALIRRGVLHDLRGPRVAPTFVPKVRAGDGFVRLGQAERISSIIVEAITSVRRAA